MTAATAETAAKWEGVLGRRMKRLNDRFSAMDAAGQAAAKRRVANLSRRWLDLLNQAREGGAL